LQEHKFNAPNKACTGRLGLCAFFGVGSELWQFSVFKLFSPQPPVTQAVGRLRREQKDSLHKVQNVGIDQKRFETI
jgi:hypothetical protein